MIEYRQYTKMDLRAWLCDGVDNGLNEEIISHVRAWSLLHCPDAKDDDVMVVAAFASSPSRPVASSPITHNPKIAGFTAIFPEHLIRPDMWIATGTTLWVDPEYADEFVGYELVKRLWEAYPHCALIGSDVARPAAMIDKLLGANIEKLERRRYILRRKIEVHSWRNLGSLFLEPYRLYRQKQHIRAALRPLIDVRVEYCNHIDAEAYAFMAAHSGGDQMLRSREMLNWWITYPFHVEAPKGVAYKTQNRFSGWIEECKQLILKVYANAELVGVTMLTKRNHDLHVSLLYSAEGKEEYTYHTIASLALHPLPLTHNPSPVTQLFSIHADLNSYLDKINIELKQYRVPFLWTYAKSFPWSKGAQLQGSDGDMFA